jgi:hypothetical protein
MDQKISELKSLRSYFSSASCEDIAAATGCHKHPDDAAGNRAEVIKKEVVNHLTAAITSLESHKDQPEPKPKH